MKTNGAVPVDRLQERFRELEAKGVTATDLAFRIGWVQSANHKRAGEGDPSRFLRAIGLVPYQDGHDGVKRTRIYVSETTALRLGRAMGLDPWELDL